MKKLALIFTILISFLIFSSCEKEEPLPDCMINGYGKITIENYTGWDLFVAVNDYNDRLIYNGESTTYFRVPAGIAEIWGSYDGYEWVWEEEPLGSCEHLTFTWYSDKKKSSGKTLLLKIKRGDEEIELNPEIRTK